MSVKVGDRAPDFYLKDDAGAVHSLAEFRGGSEGIRYYWWVPGTFTPNDIPIL